jgi:hypothetical protein
VPNETYFSTQDMLDYRVFCIAEQGHRGIGPPTAAVGDEVWILHGGRVSFVLRQEAPSELSRDDHDGFCGRSMGDAYTNGVTDGEIFENCSQETGDVFPFQLYH